MRNNKLGVTNTVRENINHPRYIDECAQSRNIINISEVYIYMYIVKSLEIHESSPVDEDIEKV